MLKPSVWISGLGFRVQGWEFYLGDLAPRCFNVDIDRAPRRRALKPPFDVMAERG